MPRHAGVILGLVVAFAILLLIAALADDPRLETHGGELPLTDAAERGQIRL